MFSLWLQLLQVRLALLSDFLTFSIALAGKKLSPEKSAATACWEHLAACVCGHISLWICHELN